MTRAEWLADLRTAFADADAVMRDILRRPQDRELAPAYHCDLYGEAAGKIAVLLDNLPDDGGVAGGTR